MYKKIPFSWVIFLTVFQLALGMLNEELIDMIEMENYNEKKVLLNDDTELNSDIKMKSPKFKGFRFEKQVIDRKQDERKEFRKHMLKNVNQFINKEWYINNYLHLTPDPFMIINLDHFPLSYIVTHPYYFDYVRPLDWITEQTQPFFETDLKQFLAYVSTSPSFTDPNSEADLTLYLPKIKFYNKVLRQISDAQEIGRLNRFTEIISEHANSVMRCDCSIEAKGCDFEFHNGSTKKGITHVFYFTEPKRISTWSKDYCCAQDINPPESTYQFINIENILRQSQDKVKRSSCCCIFDEMGTNFCTTHKKGALWRIITFSLVPNIFVFSFILLFAIGFSIARNYYLPFVNHAQYIQFWNDVLFNFLYEYFAYFIWSILWRIYRVFTIHQANRRRI